MKLDSYLSRPSRRLTFSMLAVAYLVVWSVAFPASKAVAGTLLIPAWSFARGNAQVQEPGLPAASAGVNPLLLRTPVD
jgi:hypothetical protein